MWLCPLSAITQIPRLGTTIYAHQCCASLTLCVVCPQDSIYFYLRFTFTYFTFTFTYFFFFYRLYFSSSNAPLNREEIKGQIKWQT